MSTATRESRRPHEDTGPLKRSEQLFARAQRVLPGGVNSPVRAFKAVGGTPRFIARARGARLEDVDGTPYIDYVMSWGPLIHGHAPTGLVKALGAVAKRGTSFGAPTEPKIVLGERVRTLMPSIELVRFTSSGTEATMSALRVARAATRRDLVIKFAGCYHGHADGFLVDAGSGALTFGVPTSPGVAAATAALTLTASFNDLRSVVSLFAAHPARSPPSSSSPWPATWASSPRSRVSRRAARRSATTTARCWCSTR